MVFKGFDNLDFNVIDFPDNCTVKISVAVSNWSHVKGAK